MKATVFPINAIMRGDAAIFILREVDKYASALFDTALICTLPRRQKKYIRILYDSLEQWQNPAISEIEGICNEIAGSLRNDSEAFHDDALARTLDSYKDFVSSFSHEALTPIQELRTSLELTVKRAGLDPTSAERLQHGLRSLDSLRVSLEGMRLLFRDDEKSPLPNQFRSIDASHIVKTWLSLYERQFADKNIESIAEPGNGQWRLNCVPEYLEVLVKNLVSNGVKYSFDAKDYDEPGKFVVRFDAKHNSLSFVNFGVPIDDEEIESGELFAQGHRSRSADDRGRVGKGIGLYLVKRVCDLHRATCEVTSQVMNPGGNQLFARNEFKVCFPKK
jgi:signal transduction histidine kinase